MESKFRKILPEDVYISIFDREPDERENLPDASEKECNGNRLAGNDFMDLFVRLLRKHGHKKPEFYAQLMGLTPSEMRVSIRAMSGILANEWIWRYLHLASRELLQKTNLNMTEVSEKLGFSSLNTFTRYFHRMEGISPSEFPRNLKK